MAKEDDKNSVKVMFFANDEEFTDFVMEPYAVVRQHDNGVVAIVGVYTDEYRRCVADGVRFVIKDEDSTVFRRQCVCRRVPVHVPNVPDYRRETLVQLSVENLEMYIPRLHDAR